MGSLFPFCSCESDPSTKSASPKCISRWQGRRKPCSWAQGRRGWEWGCHFQLLPYLLLQLEREPWPTSFHQPSTDIRWKIENRRIPHKIASAYYRTLPCERLSHVWIFLFFPKYHSSQLCFNTFCIVPPTDNLPVCFFIPSASAAVMRRPNEILPLCCSPCSNLSGGSAMFSWITSAVHSFPLWISSGLCSLQGLVHG